MNSHKGGKSKLHNSPLCTVFCHFIVARYSAGFVNMELLGLLSVDS